MWRRQRLAYRDSSADTIFGFEATTNCSAMVVATWLMAMEQNSVYDLTQA
jgi:hypothetical protein